RRRRGDLHRTPPDPGDGRRGRHPGGRRRDRHQPPERRPHDPLPRDHPSPQGARRLGHRGVRWRDHSRCGRHCPRAARRRQGVHPRHLARRGGVVRQGAVRRRSRGLTPALLCLAVAAARAGRFVNDPADARARMAPPHPAFAAFRKMSYVWVDGQAFEPIGDSLDHWLTYLAGNNARQAWLDVSGGEEVCRVIRSDGDETWRTVWNGGIFMLHGTEETGPPRRRETDVSAMGVQLRDAVQAELDAGATDVRCSALERALEILASQGDGEEVSDVAWPYFVLPDGSP